MSQERDFAVEHTQTRREVRSDRIDATCMIENVIDRKENLQDLVEVNDEVYEVRL